MRLIPHLILAILWVAAPASAKIIIPQEVVRDPALQPVVEQLRKLRRNEEGGPVLEAFVKAADAGSAEAQFAVGYLYSKGIGTEASEAKAEEYYLKAVEQGLAAARNNLAILRLSSGKDPQAAVAELEALAKDGFSAAECGMGQILIDGLPAAKIERDPKKAREWFEKSAAGGDPDAAFALAKLYLGAVAGIPADQAKSASFLQKAAAGGHIEAMIQLGTRHLRGDAQVPKDPSKGLGLLEKAIGTGSTVAMMHTGSLYESGELVEQDYRKALDYYRQAWEAGAAVAANKIGYFHEKGMGVAADEKAAAEWYRKGADQGAGICLYNLAVFHDEGKGGLKADPVEAFRLHYKAAMSAFVPSQVAIGLRYRDGRGVAKDPQAALAWFERAAQNGDTLGIIYCAALLESGAPGFANLPLAAKLYQQAAAKGHAGAMTALGRMAEEGRGVDPDYRVAFSLYQSAADAGFTAASERLTLLKSRLSPEQWREAEEYHREQARKAARPSAQGAPATDGATPTAAGGGESPR